LSRFLNDSIQQKMPNRGSAKLCQGGDSGEGKTYSRKRDKRGQKVRRLIKRDCRRERWKKGWRRRQFRGKRDPSGRKELIGEKVLKHTDGVQFGRTKRLQIVRMPRYRAIEKAG